MEVMKESQEERQILEIGQTAPQSPTEQPGETEMEGRRDFERRPANGMIVRRPEGGSASTTATTPVPQAPVSSATPTATTPSPTSEPVIAAQESQQTLTAQEGSSVKLFACKIAPKCRRSTNLLAVIRLQWPNSSAVVVDIQRGCELLGWGDLNGLLSVFPQVIPTYHNLASFLPNPHNSPKTLQQDLSTVRCHLSSLQHVAD